MRDPCDGIEGASRAAKGMLQYCRIVILLNKQKIGERTTATSKDHENPAALSQSRPEGPRGPGHAAKEGKPTGTTLGNNRSMKQGKTHFGYTAVLPESPAYLVDVGNA